MGEPRNANFLESMKRLWGGDTGADVIHSETLTGLGATPGEVPRRDRNISRMRNTARARQIVMEEKELERRRSEARQQAWEKKAFETMKDLGGVPPGSPPWVKDNMLTNPLMLLDAVNLDREMNSPDGKLLL